MNDNQNCFVKCSTSCVLTKPGGKSSMRFLFGGLTTTNGKPKKAIEFKMQVKRNTSGMVETTDASPQLSVDTPGKMASKRLLFMWPPASRGRTMPWISCCSLGPRKIRQKRRMSRLAMPLPRRVLQIVIMCLRIVSYHLWTRFSVSVIHLDKSC